MIKGVSNVTYICFQGGDWCTTVHRCLKLPQILQACMHSVHIDKAPSSTPLLSVCKQDTTDSVCALYVCCVRSAQTTHRRDAQAILRSRTPTACATTK